MKEQLKTEFVKLQTLDLQTGVTCQIHDCSSSYLPNYILNYTIGDKYIAGFSRTGHIYSSYNRYDEFFYKHPMKYSREFNRHENKSFAESLKILKEKIINFSTPLEKEMIR